MCGIYHSSDPAMLQHQFAGTSLKESEGLLSSCKVMQVNDNIIFAVSLRQTTVQNPTILGSKIPNYNQDRPPPRQPTSLGMDQIVSGSLVERIQRKYLKGRKRIIFMNPTCFLVSTSVHTSCCCVQ